MPTEKYAHAPEILEHCQRIGKQFGLYDNALFHTEVDRPRHGTTARSRWIDPHQPRRRVHRAVRRHGHRAAARAEAARHPRHRGRSAGTPSTPAAGTTTTPAATRRRADGQAGRQARRHHRHRRHGGAVRAASRAGRARSCTSSSARRRRSTCATTGRPTRSGSRRSPRRAGSSGGWRTSPPTRPAVLADEDLVKDGWTDIARRVRARIMALPPRSARR